MRYTVEPQSMITICKTQLENNYKDQITFDNLQEQVNYFTSVAFKNFTDYTYVRRDNTIKVNSNIDAIINCNYLFYKNNGFTEKYYFCFITNMEYVNNETTLIYFETDVFQTWMFDIKYNTCFVEREHILADVIGANTVPEGLETGEYMSVLPPTKLNNYDSGAYICMAVTELFYDFKEIDYDTRTINGVYSGLYYLIFFDEVDVNNTIRYYTTNGKGDAINSIFIIPKELVGDDYIKAFIINQPTYNIKGFIPADNLNETILENKIDVDINTKIGQSYIPKNKKLFTYPYNYTVLTNNSGANIQLNYEDFLNNAPSFKIIGAITPGCSIKCIPLNYKRISDDNKSLNSYNFGLVGGKFPICSWSSDTFINWLTSNCVNIGVSTVVNAGRIVAGDVAGGTIGIISSVGSIVQHSIIPDQAKGNTNAGDINFSVKQNVFSLYQMSIKDEYAKIIDNYFTMFGYKTNLIKVPNIKTRKYFNYVKTIDCNFSGNIPQTDLNIIRNAFNSGITFWHDPSYIYNYNVNNT